MQRDRWLLPEGIDELLPPRAAEVEALRRQLLDMFAVHGYELVTPPLLEYLDSLLTGFGSELDLLTFKVSDHATGRTMGIRTDMTSQAARIDAHSLGRDGIVRLCYAGSVLHARPARAGGSRSPYLIGAELFGGGGAAADAEVIALMSRALERAGCPAHVELGHVGLFRSLVQAAALPAPTAAALFAAVQRKSASDIRGVLAEAGTGSVLADALLALPDLLGDARTLGRAERVLAASPAATRAALDELRATAQAAERAGVTGIRFDLAELRGYDYHTGVVFCAYSEARGEAVARGGRYDGIGVAFGRARPATGFDADLLVLASLRVPATRPRPIHAPWPRDDAERARLQQAVDALRAAGEPVVQALSAGERAPDGARRLHWSGDAFAVLD
jgi:ATP phosphoribosyltransferase regulatory subunit